jgi:hypothetical protein
LSRGRCCCGAKTWPIVESIAAGGGAGWLLQQLHDTMVYYVYYVY